MQHGQRLHFEQVNAGLADHNTRLAKETADACHGQTEQCDTPQPGCVSDESVAASFSTASLSLCDITNCSFTTLWWGS